MKTLKEECQELLNLKEGEEAYLRWLEGGGAKVIKNEGFLDLFEVTQYGIKEFYEGTFPQREYGVNEIYDIVKEWD